ncbi:ABC transporter permease [Nocardia sp. NPDC005825]|uniref:ABC transporter permease n=1 Tax=unclassified Nocardia TaxID=2637762 RepID=UPI003402BE81
MGIDAVASPGIGLAVVCVVLVAAAAAIYWFARLGPVVTAPLAAARAVIQLAAVASVLVVALSQLWSSLLVLAAMFAAATVTAARRSGAGWSASWLTLSLGTGACASLLPMLVGGVVPLTGVTVVPIGGILLGGTMTATSLASRRALDALETRQGEVEAALSLGFTARDARWEIISLTAFDALLPGVDQTRTVGLVTLPGAFVGVLIASGSAVQAAATQVLVLLGLLLAQACAVAITIEMVARGRVHRPGRVLR